MNWEHLIERTIILCNQGKYEEAIRSIVTDPTIAPGISKHREIDPTITDDRLLLYLGETLRQLGNLTAAIKLVKHSEKYARRSNNLPLASDSLHILGLLYKENFQEFDTAMQYYEDALKIRQKLADTYRIAASLHELGIIHQFKGEFDKAIDKYNQSLKYSSELSDLYQMGNTLAQIGRVHYQQENYNGAVQKYALAYNIMDMISAPNLPLVKQWLSELQSFISRADIMAALEEASVELLLKFQIRDLRICPSCQRPIRPRSLDGRPVYGTWCQHKQR